MVPLDWQTPFSRREAIGCVPTTLSSLSGNVYSGLLDRMVRQEVKTQI